MVQLDLGGQRGLPRHLIRAFVFQIRELEIPVPVGAEAWVPNPQASGLVPWSVCRRESVGQEYRQGDKTINLWLSWNIRVGFPREL